MALEKMSHKNEKALFEFDQLRTMMSEEVWSEKPKPKRREKDGEEEENGKNAEDDNCKDFDGAVAAEEVELAIQDFVETDEERSQLKSGLERTSSSEKGTSVAAFDAPAAAAFDEPLPQRSRVKDQRSDSPSTKKARHRNRHGVGRKGELQDQLENEDILGLQPCSEDSERLLPQPEDRERLFIEKRPSLQHQPVDGQSLQPKPDDRPSLQPKRDDRTSLQPPLDGRLNVPSASKTKKRSLTPDPSSVTKNGDDNFRDPDSAGSTKEWPSIGGNSNRWSMQRRETMPLSFSSMAKNLSSQGWAAPSSLSSSHALGIIHF